MARERHLSSSVTLTAPVLTPPSGVRAAARYEERTLVQSPSFQESDEETTHAFDRSGVVPREPATEPHLVAASPFDQQPPPRESGLRPGPLSETRLDVAPPISSDTPDQRARARALVERTGSTLCSPGVVRVDDVTLPHFPFDREEPTSVAGLPQPLLGFGWLRRLARAITRIFSRDES